MKFNKMFKNQMQRNLNLETLNRFNEYVNYGSVSVDKSIGIGDGRDFPVEGIEQGGDVLIRSVLGGQFVDLLNQSKNSCSPVAI